MNEQQVKDEAEAKRLYEVRFAFGVSIIGAIENAAPLAEKSLAELRVVAEEVEKLLGFIKMQLGQIDGRADIRTEALNDVLAFLGGVFNAPRENVGPIECYRPRLSVKRVNGLAWRIKEILKGQVNGNSREND